MACLFLKERNKHVKEINQKYDCKILYTDGRVIKIYLISFSEIITIKQARNFYAGTCGKIYFVKSFATLEHNSYLYLQNFTGFSHTTICVKTILQSHLGN